MSELRRDALFGHLVLVAPERGLGSVLPARRLTVPAAACPFCPGQESSTAPELHAHRPQGEANGSGWTLRVVPARTPVLRVETRLEREPEGPHDRISGSGAHELFIESAAHDARWSTLGVDGLERLLHAWGLRTADLARDGRLRAAVVGRDEGSGHPVSELLALPTLPPALAALAERAEAHFAVHERALGSDLLAHTLKDGSRVVAENAEAVAFVPWAPRHPFALHLMTRTRIATLAEASKSQLRALATLASDVARRLDRALESRPLHAALHAAPLRSARPEAFHAVLELWPGLLSPSAPSEAAGLSLDPVGPEVAAAHLRALVP